MLQQMQSSVEAAISLVVLTFPNTDRSKLLQNWQLDCVLKTVLGHCWAVGTAACAAACKSLIASIPSGHTGEHGRRRLWM